LAWAIMAVFIQSCFEDDKRVKPYPFDVYTITDSVQLYRSFFDLETGRTVKVHPMSQWQLGFECGSEGYRIITNSGAQWFIYNTRSQSQASAISMPLNLQGMYDVQSLWPDSTATGNWCPIRQNNQVYTNDIYLLGKYAQGSFHEIKEITFSERTDTSYTFSYRDRDSGFGDTVMIKKNNVVNFVYYSFSGRDQLNLEPEKTDYDLVFCSYYDLATLFSQTIPYQVAGALLNVYATEAALDSVADYAGIDLSTVQNIAFSSQKDVPGYQWKNVIVDISGGTATYLIKTHYTYLVRTSEGNYYKLRFLSYTLDGSSGFPRFEFSRLE